MDLLVAEQSQTIEGLRKQASKESQHGRTVSTRKFMHLVIINVFLLDIESLLMENRTLRKELSEHQRSDSAPKINSIELRELNQLRDKTADQQEQIEVNGLFYLLQKVSCLDFYFRL